MNPSETLGYHCGFGGCKAPEAPVPMQMPGPWAEIEVRRDTGKQDTVIPILHLGFGGCKAPAKPVPVYCPSAYFLAVPLRGAAGGSEVVLAVDSNLLQWQ